MWNEDTTNTKSNSQTVCKLVNQTESFAYNFTYNSVSKDALLLRQLSELVILFPTSLSPCPLSPTTIHSVPSAPR